VWIVGLHTRLLRGGGVRFNTRHIFLLMAIET